MVNRNSQLGFRFLFKYPIKFELESSVQTMVIPTWG